MVEQQREVDHAANAAGEAKPTIGWIKATMDTGARSSALHAFDLDHFERDGTPSIRFEIHPWQRSNHDATPVEAEMVDHRPGRPPREVRRANRRWRHP